MEERSHQNVLCRLELIAAFALIALYGMQSLAADAPSEIEWTSRESIDITGGSCVSVFDQVFKEFGINILYDHETVKNITCGTSSLIGQKTHLRGDVDWVLTTMLEP